MRPMSQPPPRFRSHYRPRTTAGWVAIVSFTILMAMAQPPIVHTLANRIEPSLLGMPFLYVYLLAVYVMMIGVLIWAMRKGV